MDTLFQLYAYHMDKLREQSGIKIGDFCEGVCDPRTYRYYINGERLMSQKVLNGFCEKLGFSPKEFYSSYTHSDKEEYQEVAQLYIDSEYEDNLHIRAQFLKFDNYNFTHPQAKALYDYTVTSFNLRTGKITKQHAFDLFTSSIDYPKILSKKVFTTPEILTLKEIAYLEFLLKEDRAYNFFKEMLINPDITFATSELKDILPHIYGFISWMAGLKKEIETSKYMAKKSIDLSHRLRTMDQLDKVYYYYTLSCYKLGEDTWKESLHKYIGILFVKYDKETIQKKLDMLERDGMKNPMQYFDLKYVKWLNDTKLKTIMNPK